MCVCAGASERECERAVLEGRYLGVVCVWSACRVVLSCARVESSERHACELWMSVKWVCPVSCVCSRTVRCRVVVSSVLSFFCGVYVLRVFVLWSVDVFRLSGARDDAARRRRHEECQQLLPTRRSASSSRRPTGSRKTS